MSDHYKLGYAYGSRWVEKVIALGLTFTVMFLLAIYIKKFSQRALEGFYYGAFASFMIKGLRLSVFAEGNLVMLAMIVIGISLGWAALGMGIAAWLLFSAITTGLIVAVNYTIFHERSK